MTGLVVIKESETLNMLNFSEAATGMKFCLMKEHFKKAVRELEYWRNDCQASNFTASLFRLICKADDKNKAKILKGFPDEMIAYLLWYKSEKEEKFFAEWGCNEEP